MAGREAMFDDAPRTTVLTVFSIEKTLTILCKMHRPTCSLHVNNIAVVSLDPLGLS